MDWLLLAALGIIWMAFLIPSLGGRKATSPRSTVEEFEHRMDLLAETDGSGASDRAQERDGRWVMSPRKGVHFMGPKARERARVLERRRKVLVGLAEVTALFFMIGLVPPLRGMWAIAGVSAFLLGVYCYALIRIKHMESGTVPQRAATHARGNARDYHAAARNGYSTGQRYVAEGHSAVARATYAGMAGVDSDEIHVVVREA